MLQMNGYPKSQYRLTWYDNGKQLYKLFFCSFPEIANRFEGKNKLFKKVAVYEKNKRII